MDDESVKHELKAADEIVTQSPLCIRTPLLADCWDMVQSCFIDSVKASKPSKLSLKLENTQRFGSFKIRGVVNQFHHLPENASRGEVSLVTMSAGNYGRSFTEACVQRKLKGLVVLPDFAPSSRIQFMESKGIKTEQVASCDVMAQVEQHKKNGCMFLHPFDDPLLFYGYGSASKEIFEDEPQVDVIVICCGGGGFLSGVAMDAKLRNPNCVIYGVEPCTANTMYRSFELGKAASLPNSKSIASGLSPPYAGENAYGVCKDRVEKILLVSDEQIRHAFKCLYNYGLVVEPAGSAAFAALMYDKVPDIANKNVVVVLTGGNMTVEELNNI